MMRCQAREAVSSLSQACAIAIAGMTDPHLEYPAASWPCHQHLQSVHDSFSIGEARQTNWQRLSIASLTRCICQCLAALQCRHIAEKPSYYEDGQIKQCRPFLDQIRSHSA